MSLGMNQVAIMTLLMGEHLYSRKGVALREVIQNAVDACVVRQKLALASNYVPAVKLSLFAGQDNQTWIEIRDNGIGMDEHVLSEYFLKLGNSYYRSAEFHRLSRGSQFIPISRFGIGIASLFMVGDVLEVTTVAANSARQDATSRFVRIERMGGLAYVSENVDWTDGTRVRVRLNASMQPESAEFAREVIAYLKETIVRPKVSVTLKIGSAGFVAGPQTWLTPKPEAVKQLSLSGRELVPITFDGISDRISGVAYLFLRIAGDHLSLFNPDGGRFAAFGHLGDFNTVFQRYSGNRITVSGFKMGMKKQRAFHGQGKAVLPLAFDIEIQADDSVVFDVARDRLMGETKPLIVNEFRRSIYRALLQGGILKRLDDSSKELVERILLAKYPPTASDRPILDELLLGQVEALLPKSKWPQLVHKEIAKELNSTPSKVSRAISTLIKQKRVTKPDSA
jgi:molecular chaperone HtpG